MKTRTCGRCNGKDTILICMECLRELKEERNAEVKQAIEEVRNKWQEDEGLVILETIFGDIEPVYEQLTELLQKLGLEDGK